MGCASSKQRVCRKCQAAYSPVRRSHSMHWHQPPLNDVESDHVVALTSSTLGSLMLDPLNQNSGEEENGGGVTTVQAPFGSVKSVSSDEFAAGLTEAMTWSQMIDKKIGGRTPVSGEPEMINAWELMKDLEDISPLKPSRSHARSFSFHVSPNPMFYPPIPRTKDDTEASPKQQWSSSEVADNESNSTSASNDTSVGFASEFDPEVIATFRKALAELPPATPFRLKPLAPDNIDSPEVITDSSDHTKSPPESGNKNRVIVYFTSLRGVRRTYEDCCYVRTILQGLGVKVDDRDVSMHSGFKDELKELLGESYGGGGLPRVFVGKNYIGGADEIRRMHEDGQLEKLVEFCETVDESGGGGKSGDCGACGDIRFVPCETCSGSCKIYCEGGGNGEEDDQEFGFQRCPDCNENGLIRCPICCD
ncbi:PREDICTED: uncharacterized protein At3g28850-like [Ipomoea nil]|uniref:uncharacterized protein At3g28850-like n=1 Tax=Ipomoea nil TaxID=35883 RepID=UPI000900EEB3|nr:PREDICTED: uncharacterized protein At3g28850-like [Ipomoea nil]